MNRKVLVVEDDAIQADSFSCFLNNNNFEARSVLNAEAALSILAAKKFDYFLVDLYMPGLDGIELVTKLREITNEKTPVILMTAASSADIATRVNGIIDLQPIVVLQKPFTTELLLSTLLKLKEEIYDKGKKQADIKPVMSQLGHSSELRSEDKG
jgi:DNA-binding response OmpR family regulator